MKIRVVLFGLAACGAACTAPLIACGRIFPMIFETNLRFGGQLGFDEPLAAGTGTVGVYDGKTKKFDPALVLGLNMPQAIAVGGDNLFVVNSVGGKFGQSIGEYNALTGQSIDDHLISGLQGRVGVVAFGDILFVTSSATHKISRIDEYSATTGALIKPGFVMGLKLKGPAELAVSGGDLFVVNSTDGKNGESIGEYNATTGATVNTTLVTRLHGRIDIAVSGTSLFVASSTTHRIDEYDTTTGMLVAAGFVTGLHGQADIAVFDGNLFVTNGHRLNEIDEYNATTGALEDAVITGLHGPQGLTVVPVSGSVADASSSWLLLLLGFIATFGLKVILRQPA